MNNPKKKFSQIYDQYIDKIYRFIFVKVNSQEIAEDLTSEVFLRCWEAFKNQKSKISPRTKAKLGAGQETQNSIENPQAFLYQIARNLVVDHYREKGRTRVVSADCVPIIDPNSNLEEKTLIKSDLEAVKAAMFNLKSDYQDVLVWYYLEDLSVPEIAKMTNKSEGAVRVIVHRALKALKNELESKENRTV